MKEVVRKKRAFTLIELLVVVLIIGILAAVAVPQYNKAMEKSRFVQALTVVKALGNAQEMYYLENGFYATQIEQLNVDFPFEEYTFKSQNRLKNDSFDFGL